MDDATRRRFAELWMQRPKIKLSTIAVSLGCSFNALAKERMEMGLAKRYGNYSDDGEIPMPHVIKLRAAAQQTNWTEEERRLRWRGQPHTIYDSVSTCDYQP